MSSKNSPFYRRPWFFAGWATLSVIFFAPLILVIIPLLWSGPVSFFGKDPKEMTDKKKLQLTWLIVIFTIGSIIFSLLSRYR